MDTPLYVVDSSVIVKWITSEKEECLKQADALLERIQKLDQVCAAPFLAYYEVGNAIRYKKLTEIEQITCLENLYHLPIKYMPMNFPLAKKTLQIARKHEITYYDAAFLTLANKLSCPLVTANPKHQKKFTDIKVIALADFR